MRDLRAVIHGITTAVLCGVAVFSCSTISKAAGETYQTAVEAMEILSVESMRTILPVPR